MTNEACKNQGGAALRQSNFELLRIFTMVAILAHHFSVHADFNYPLGDISMNRMWILLLQISGKVGVNIFSLISGYFLIKSNGIKTHKVLRLWLQIFFWSMFPLVVFVAIGLEPFSKGLFIKALFPVTYTHWWYASTYFVLYLISPYMNMLLNQLDQKAYKKLLILLTVCWCIIPTLMNAVFESNSLLWLIYLYAVAGYIRLWGSEPKANGRRYFLHAVAWILISVVLTVALEKISERSAFIGKYIFFYYNMQAVPIFLIALFIFLGFREMNIGCVKSINTVSSTTFGVYLIHENFCIRPFLWLTLFKNAAYKNSPMLIPYSLMVIGLVFVSCSLLEWLRIRLLENNYMPLLKRWSYGIDECISRFCDMKFFDRI